jgi:trans-aconitate 2-methyltransferase
MHPGRWSRRRFAGNGRVRVERQDLRELEVEELVDVVFSTATFHWVLDHERLFDRLARALRPGGRLVAQCGGKGNIARTMAATEEVMGEARFKDTFAGWEGVWNFADPETTKARLESAGFEDVESWLHEEPTRFGSVGELARFLKTVVLRQHVAVLPEGERDAFSTAVAARLAERGSLVVDYVRLNIIATRTGAA